MNKAIRFIALFVMIGAVVIGAQMQQHTGCGGCTSDLSQQPMIAQVSDMKPAMEVSEIASSPVLPETSSGPASPTSPTSVDGKDEVALPKMIDLGANKCLACKKMAPILEEAGRDYQGKALIEFIDVWENRSAGAQYGVRMIPTQIFYDADGKEVYRHEGFLAREAIDEQFKKLGVQLNKE